MNKEIKEILDRLKEDLYIPMEDNREYKLLDKGDDKLLSDYITNLEQENERLKLNINNAKEFIEQHRVREMSIVEVNTLEGILNE